MKFFNRNDQVPQNWFSSIIIKSFKLSNAVTSQPFEDAVSEQWSYLWAKSLAREMEPRQLLAQAPPPWCLPRPLGCPYQPPDFSSEGRRCHRLTANIRRRVLWRRRKDIMSRPLYQCQQSGSHHNCAWLLNWAWLPHQLVIQLRVARRSCQRTQPVRWPRQELYYRIIWLPFRPNYNSWLNAIGST